MTTLLGIKANHGVEGIVLASDTQMTMTTKRRSQKRPILKILSGQNDALAYSGNVDATLFALANYLVGKKDRNSFIRTLFSEKEAREMNGLWGTLLFGYDSARQRLIEVSRKEPSAADDRSVIENAFQQCAAGHPPLSSSPADRFFMALYNHLLQPNDPIQEALKTGFLPEVWLNNLVYSRANADEEEDDTNEFILATNKPELGLYHINSFGALIHPTPSKNISFVTIGTGADFVNEYFDEEKWEEDKLTRNITLGSITIPQAMELAVAALRCALKDESTGGIIDIGVVTMEKIKVHGLEIGKQLQEAENKVYQGIIAQYDQPEKPEKSG